MVQVSFIEQYDKETEIKRLMTLFTH